LSINLAIAERARAGAALTMAELDELSGADLLSLGMLADDVRRARVGETVTYLRVLELPRDADAPGPAQAREVRIAHLPGTLASALAAIASARTIAGDLRLAGFSLADVNHRNWGGLTDVLKQFKAAGLDAITEAPIDQLQDPEAALEAAGAAGLPVQCLSVQKPAGDNRSPLFVRLRSLAERFPSITTVAPLPREQSVAVPTTGYDDVRSVALARLALPVPNIQVDWLLYGPKLAQVALTFGANDIDRVSPIDDETLGRRRTAAEDVRRNITAAGFTPVERGVPA
jgi:aminodeoxyfutalosine synthase